MILNYVAARDLAEYLLQIKAIVLSPQKPFTWTSGIKSPIYCDMRKTLAYPKIRTFIKTTFSDLIQEEYDETEVIAGVATAGIPQAALVADVLQLPMVYVRDKAKAHGMQHQIEGHLEPGQKVMVIEDLFSTGGSSLKAGEALIQAGSTVIGYAAVFNYGFESTVKAFEQTKTPFFSLCNYSVLLETALKERYINEEEKTVLEAWYKAPEAWGV